MEGKTARGASSPAKPALHMPEPLSTTRAAASSSHILVKLDFRKRNLRLSQTTSDSGLTKLQPYASFYRLHSHSLFLEHASTQILSHYLSHLVSHYLTFYKAWPSPHSHPLHDTIFYFVLLLFTTAGST